VTPSDPLVAMSGIEKAFGGLRPLRIQSLAVAPSSLVAVLGLDAPAAEMFTNLATGAILPDRGEVRLFGQLTSGVTDVEAWLRLLDRVGILTDRAVLLDTMSVAQNLAMPVTLELDPLSSELAARAAALAREVGLTDEAIDRPVGSLSAGERLRVRFGRALALEPVLLLMEHPTATLDRADVATFANDVRRVCHSRGLAGIAITADRTFAQGVTSDLRELRGADGVLVPRVQTWNPLRRFFER
jgi:ABC-type transporter Mla maintaining outer membrane lipid asymmetry ATPase subunit MlaF